MAQPPDDFYEDDEPVEKILAILDRPPDGVTARPGPGGIVVAGAPGITASGNRLIEQPGVAVA